MRYEIIHADTIEELNEAVTERLNEGWTIVGQPWSNQIDVYEWWWYQAMIYYEEPVALPE